MDREKAIARIKKCLALSKSPNEHEAAAALRQAQKLMALHGIDIDDVDESAIVSDFVDHDDYEYASRKPIIILAVVHLMRLAFGVESVWERSTKGTHRIRYFGQQANVMLATHSHVVVYRAVNDAWREYLKANPAYKGVRNARAGFAAGWCETVASKVAALSPDPETVERITRKKLDHYGEKLSDATAGSKSMYVGAYADGVARGVGFDINRPVGSDRRYLENKP